MISSTTTWKVGGKMKDFHYLLDYGIVFPGKAGKGRNDDVSHRGHTRRIVVVNEEDSPLRVQKVHRIRVKPLNHSGTSAFEFPFSFFTRTAGFEPAQAEPI